MLPDGSKLKGRAHDNCLYCAFKDDRGRLRALISRDVRFVLITLALICAGADGRLWSVAIAQAAKVSR